MSSVLVLEIWFELAVADELGALTGLSIWIRKTCFSDDPGGCMLVFFLGWSFRVSPTRDISATGPWF